MFSVCPKAGSMHGNVPQGSGAWRILCSSTLLGIRQSQWLAKQVVLAEPLVSRFSVVKKPVNNDPSAAVPELVQLYPLITSCTSPVPAGDFFSHISPVWLSVIVPSPLSTYRG